MSNSAAPDSFAEVEAQLKRFSLASFHDAKQVAEYSELFGLARICKGPQGHRSTDPADEATRIAAEADAKLIQANFPDLARLHWLALSRKTINILEFGSGYSTAILADAMRLLHAHFQPWAAANTRCATPFHVYSVEEDQSYLERSTARLGSELGRFATISRSSVELVTHDFRVVTVYSCLPNISPDFIYLDGPSQYATTAALNGFSLNDRARMPMSADILRVEFFLEPGTLVVADGRTQNARFLKAYLRRNWAYQHDPVGDLHYFELQESPLGRVNAGKLQFCLGGKWLLPEVA